MSNETLSLKSGDSARIRFVRHIKTDRNQYGPYELWEVESMDSGQRYSLFLNVGKPNHSCFSDAGMVLKAGLEVCFSRNGNNYTAAASGADSGLQSPCGSALTIRQEPDRPRLSAYGIASLLYALVEAGAMDQGEAQMTASLCDKGIVPFSDEEAVNLCKRAFDDCLDLESLQKTGGSLVPLTRIMTESVREDIESLYQARKSGMEDGHSA